VVINQKSEEIAKNVVGNLLLHCESKSIENEKGRRIWYKVVQCPVTRKLRTIEGCYSGEAG
jgi:hypothetical protein